MFASLTRRPGLRIERSRVRRLLVPYGENGDEDRCDGAHPAQDGPKSANQVGAHGALLTEVADALLHPRGCGTCVPDLAGTRPNSGASTEVNSADGWTPDRDGLRFAGYLAELAD